MDMKNKSFYCSWSGGKDSCLSLYRAIKMGGNPKFLFTMFTENGDRSRAHGLDRKILEMQAKSLGISLITADATWDDYENTYLESLEFMKRRGIEAGVFGDIDLTGGREWVEMVCDKVGIEACLPVWGEKRETIVNEIIRLGFKAKIVSLNPKLMDKKFLGRVLDYELVEELKKENIDPCGEGGEFHTLVVDGPIFTTPLDIVYKEPIEDNNHWILDMEIK